MLRASQGLATKGRDRLGDQSGPVEDPERDSARLMGACEHANAQLLGRIPAGFRRTARSWGPVRAGEGSSRDCRDAGAFLAEYGMTCPAFPGRPAGDAPVTLQARLGHRIAE
jgi:hypothetical protein